MWTQKKQGKGMVELLDKMSPSTGEKSLKNPQLDSLMLYLGPYCFLKPMSFETCVSVILDIV
jgi:hypothetical protein